MTKYSMQGCTAVTAAISGPSSSSPSQPRQIAIANCGDSRAIIGTKDGRVRLATHDHKPNSPSERKRILAAGGTVDQIQGQYRVSGNLNLSRALGDLRYKTNMEQGRACQVISGRRRGTTTIVREFRVCE